MLIVEMYKQEFLQIVELILASLVKDFSYVTDKKYQQNVILLLKRSMRILYERQRRFIRKNGIMNENSKKFCYAHFRYKVEHFLVSLQSEVCQLFLTHFCSSKNFHLNYALELFNS